MYAVVIFRYSIADYTSLEQTLETLQYINNYTSINIMVLSSEQMSDLIELSVDAKKTSYSPYSNFRVGCALRTKCGKVFQGCNVENASYGLSICAERTAYTKAVSEGKDDLHFYLNYSLC